MKNYGVGPIGVIMSLSVLFPIILCIIAHIITLSAI